MPLTAGLTKAAGTVVKVIWLITLAGLAAFAAYAVLGLGRGTADSFFENVVMQLIEFCAAGMCLARGILIADKRAAWIAMGIGVLASACGDLVYAVYLKNLHPVPFPSIGDALWLVWYPTSYFTLMLLIRGRVRRFHPSMWLDGAIGGLGLAALAAALVLGPIVKSSTGSLAAVVTNLSYPVGDLLLLAFVMGMCALTGWRPGRGWLALGAGLLLNAVADVLYLFQVAKGQYVEGAMLDVLWPAGYALLGYAAWQSERESKVKMDGLRVLFAPALFTLTSIGILVYDHFARVDTAAMALATGALMLALVRVGLTFREVGKLAETRRLAQTDDLTGLRNRRYFYGRLAGALEQTEAEGQSMSVLIIDLDRFKELNDTLGHHAGDLLLQQIGPRLAEALPEVDTMARLGGDEFAVLVPGPRGRSAAGVAAARRILGALERPFQLGDLSLHVEASIGVAVYPDHGTDSEVLLQRADVAMYEAKAQHSGCELYAAERDQHSRDRLTLMSELRGAIESGQLVVHYQPKARLVGGRVIGVEALVRWQHPERGLLGPYEFIPMAEQTGLMRPLTLFVMRSALAQNAEWRSQGIDLGVAVNLAVPNLIDIELVTDVELMLREYGVAPDRLQLEITEDSVMADPVRASEVLDRFRELGVGVSLDDFGTGYSSLAYLKRLAVDELKIDKSFVMDMTSDDEDAVIVRSTVDLAKNLGLRVVAEGVETEAAWDHLARMGCDVAQGYLLAKPLPAAELTAWIEARDSALLPAPADSWRTADSRPQG